MLRSFSRLALTFAIVSGCGSDPTGLTDGNEEPGEGDGDDDVSTPTKRDAGAGTPGKDGGGKPRPGGGPGDTCERKTLTAGSTPPDILIVLDKSLSMAPARWVPSTMAVNQLATKYQSQVSFGLELFPAGFTCEPGQLDVPMELNNADKIATTIMNAIPIGITPTAQSLRNALMFLGDRHAAGDNRAVPAYVVLVTDGTPNCMDDATPDPPRNSIEACTALLEAKIPTYVIGYQIDALGQATMEEMAKAGGTEKFFPVENQMDLEAAFDEITKDVVRCEFELSEEPLDPTFVRITIDGETVALDASDGWAIDGRKVTLGGASCATLKDGSTHSLDVNVECNPVMVM